MIGDVYCRKTISNHALKCVLPEGPDKYPNIKDPCFHSVKLGHVLNMQFALFKYKESET